MLTFDLFWSRQLTIGYRRWRRKVGFDNVALRKWSSFCPQPWRCGLCPMTGPGLPSVPKVGRAGSASVREHTGGFRHTNSTSGMMSGPSALCSEEDTTSQLLWYYPLKWLPCLILVFLYIDFVNFTGSYWVCILHTYALNPTITCFIMQEPEVSLIFVDL